MATQPQTSDLPQQNINIIQRLFDVGSVYDDQLDQQKASTLMIMCLIFGVLGFFGTLGFAIFLTGVLPTYLLIPDLFLGGLYLVLYILARNGRLQIASYAFIVVALLVPIVQVTLGSVIPATVLMLAFSIPIVSAALLIAPNWAFITAFISIISAVYVNYQDYLIATAESVDVVDFAPFLVNMGATGFLLTMLALFSWLLANTLYRWAYSSQRRARQLEAAAVISETSAIAPTLRVLLNDVVDRIRDAYGFYHAQVFLVDQEGRMARLEASTGRAGEALLARGHALAVGSRSVIGQCTYSGQPVVINDVRTDPTHRPNELLPDTRGELALPLNVSGEVIGALDVQSVEPNSFQPDDVRSLQLMANQLATAIEKTRLVSELEVRATETERLYQDAQESLQQIEDLNRRLTREGWSDYLRVKRSSAGLGYTIQDTAVVQDTSWTAPMRQAYQGEQTVVIRQDEDVHIAAVPLRIRGQVIGVLEIERGGNDPWEEEDIELAEMLVDRLALAVENARLFEQASEAADREHAVNEIAQHVQAADTIDDVLQIALAELGTVLGAKRGMVQISPKEGAVGEDHQLPAASDDNGVEGG